jgi:hypothetical protein
MRRASLTVTPECICSEVFQIRFKVFRLKSHLPNHFNFLSCHKMSSFNLRRPDQNQPHKTDVLRLTAWFLIVGHRIVLHSGAPEVDRPSGREDLEYLHIQSLFSRVTDEQWTWMLVWEGKQEVVRSSSRILGRS